ncbi:hypothetical protein HAX54_017106 [Datura stramonium]|uniref:Uncharacterized protein n=1 Tax=Datura stramonium TaxID=4076 RepID=A0ABS8UK57_DATST|nr:hypothetical protein [Datura stramonium]
MTDGKTAGLVENVGDEPRFEQPPQVIYMDPHPSICISLVTIRPSNFPLSQREVVSANMVINRDPYFSTLKFTILTILELRSNWVIRSSSLSNLNIEICCKVISASLKGFRAF